MIITVCNEKGGSGKSNVAINLAIKFIHDGLDVLLVDTDVQGIHKGTINSFLNIRENAEVVPAIRAVSMVGKKSIAADLKAMSSKYDVIVVDTPGSDSIEMRLPIVASDIIIIPTFPSDADLPGLEKMFDVFRDAKINNQNLKALVVVSRASPNPFLKDRITQIQEYAKSAELEDVIVMDSVISERIPFQNAFSAGQGVVEFCSSGEKAYAEFNAFYDELKNHIADSTKE